MMNTKIKIFMLVLTLLSLCGIISPAFSAEAADDQFQKGLTLLQDKSFEKKEQGIELISTSGSPKSYAVLSNVLEGNLYFTKSGENFVVAELDGGDARIKDILTDEDLGTVKKRDIKKITINNQLRGTLKAAIAQLDLTSPDKNIRLAAVMALLDNISPESVKPLEKYLKTEKNSDVKEYLHIALALAGLQDSSANKRLEALGTLKGALHPAVKNAVQQLLDKEQDEAVKHKAETILSSIEVTTAWYGKLETIFFGLSMGSVLVLAAIGLAITFGVIGVINMAHGELIMLGAYTTYVIQQLMPNNIGLSVILAIPAAFCVSGLVGIVIEKSVIRFLYGRPLETLLATFGISLVLQQAVRSIFSPLNKSVATPEWMSGSIMINPVLSLTTNRVTIFIFAILVFAGLFLLMKKSSLGLHVRAVSQNRAMAKAMGVRAARVDALTFGLGSGIAGIAGVALSQLTNVGPNLGQAYIVDSFMVVVFGGVGNLWGTMLGGLTLGVANKILEPWSGAVLAKILILVFIILFIQKRPQGLFPQKGRAAE